MSEPKRILLVEVEQAILDSFHLLSADTRFVVRKLPDSRLVLAMVREFKPHIIFMDHDTPGGRNKLALQMLKGHALVKHIPVIWLTAHADGSHAARQHGADGHLVKPIGPGAIIEMTARFTGGT
jgi:DNA-binding response OmpR family regulator